MPHIRSVQVRLRTTPACTADAGKVVGAPVSLTLRSPCSAAAGADELQRAGFGEVKSATARPTPRRA